jgi:hypothetical protein
MGLQHCPIQDPFLPAIHSSAKQIVSSHAHYIFVTYLQWLTNNFKIVHTKNQIHFFKKENTIPCSLAQQAIGLPYGLTTLPYPRPFSSCNLNIPQPNKLLVFMHIIFSKSCILTVPVIFIYPRIQSKRKYYPLPMHHFSRPNFSK